MKKKVDAALAEAKARMTALRSLRRAKLRERMHQEATKRQELEREQAGP